MTTYTTRPSRHVAVTGYIDIFCDGEWRGSCPAERADETIAHMRDSAERHWTRAYERLQALDPNLVIAGGAAYSIGRDTDNPRGFGGQRWSIRFHDGREIVTVSLWHLGNVPCEWRDHLPDNARLEATR